jgi:hypothetical protein
VEEEGEEEEEEEVAIVTAALASSSAADRRAVCMRLQRMLGEAEEEEEEALMSCKRKRTAGTEMSDTDASIAIGEMQVFNHYMGEVVHTGVQHKGRAILEAFVDDQFVQHAEGHTQRFAAENGTFHLEAAIARGRELVHGTTVNVFGGQGRVSLPQATGPEEEQAG